MGIMDAVNTFIAGGSLLPTAASLFASNTNNHAGRDQRQAISYANRSAVIDKVAAAKEAGISPLYALGAPVISASSQVGSSGGGADLGRSLAGMGQDIGRAISAQQTSTEREAARLALEGAGLDNDIKRAQLAKILGPGNPPSMPIVGGPSVSSPASLTGDVGTRKDTMMDFSGYPWLVDKGVVSANDVQQEYGDISENVDGFMHYITDKVIRPGNAATGEMPAWADPWKMGGVAAMQLRDAIATTLRDLGLRRGKRYYDRLPESSGW